MCSAGRPEEQDDSENSTIYITGLTENATLDEVAEFFKHSGIIRVFDTLFQYNEMAWERWKAFFFFSMHNFYMHFIGYLEAYD